MNNIWIIKQSPIGIDFGELNIDTSDIIVYLGRMSVMFTSNILANITAYKVMCRADDDLTDTDTYIALGFDAVCDICNYDNLIFSNSALPNIPNDSMNIFNLGEINLKYNYIQVTDSPVKVDTLLANNMTRIDTGTAEPHANKIKKNPIVLDISHMLKIYPMDEVSYHDIMSMNRISDVDELYNWMKRNLDQYDADIIPRPLNIILKTGRATSYEQCMFAYKYLDMMGYEPELMYLVTTNNNDQLDDLGISHMMIYWVANDSVYWLENCWTKHNGVHKYSSVDDMIYDIKAIVSKTNSMKHYPNIRIYNLSMDTFIRLSSDKSDLILGRKIMGEADLLSEFACPYDNSLPLNEILFGSVDDTKYWLADDDNYEELEKEAELKGYLPTKVLESISIMEYLKEDAESNNPFAYYELENEYHWGPQRHAFDNFTSVTPYVPDKPEPVFELADRSFKFYNHDNINEAVDKSEPLLPVYVLLIYSGSAMAKIIKGATNGMFSHASISFDTKLDNMYSFNMTPGPTKETTKKTNGLVKETIYKDSFMKSDIPYALYMVPVRESQYKKMKKKLQYFINNANKFIYDTIGLVKIFLGISDNPETRFFCSRFVADVIQAGNTRKEALVKDPSLIKPDTFTSLQSTRYVVGGLLRNYNKSKTDKIVAKILSAEELSRRGDRLLKSVLGKDAELLPSKYRRAILENHMAHTVPPMDNNTTDQVTCTVAYNINNEPMYYSYIFDSMNTLAKRHSKILREDEDIDKASASGNILIGLSYIISTVYMNPIKTALSTEANIVRNKLLKLRSNILRVLETNKGRATTNPEAPTSTRHKYSSGIRVVYELS